MPRKGMKRRRYAVNKSKRKRSSAFKFEKYGFRKSMLRSLDELEVGGHLPGYNELKHIFDSTEATIEFCIDKGIFDCPKHCPRCQQEIKPYDPKKHTVRCRRVDCAFTCPTVCQRCDNDDMEVTIDADGSPCKSDCKECNWQWRPGLEFERSIFRNSFMQGAKLPKHEIMHLMWLWLLKVPSSTAATMLIWSEQAASDWYKFFRKMVSQMLEHGTEETMLGGYDENGEPIIVEIDETKMGKRKYNKGRRVSASWVIGMVERTKQRRTAWVVVEKRNASVCTAVIRKFIKAGSIIHSDEWGGYNPISKMGLQYTHRRLCHKREFVNTKDGFRTHTQTIEGNNSAVKKAIPVHKRNGEDLQDCLFEFMWRRNNAGTLWPALLRGLATVRYTVPELRRVDEVDEPWEKTDILINTSEMKDYDSAATESTDSEEEDGNSNSLARAAANVGNGAAATGNHVARRQGRKWTGQPMVEAVPSAIFRQREQDAADAQLAINIALGPEPGSAPTKDGERSIV